MTPRERELLDYLIAETDRGVTPTFSDITRALGLASKSGVCRLVASLARQGLITRRADKRRSVVVLAGNPAYTAEAIDALSPEAFGRLRDAMETSRQHRRDVALRAMLFPRASA